MTNQVAHSSDSRPLGRSGISVFPLAFGMWRFAGVSVADATSKIDAALDVGINLFDTADIYGYNGQDGFGDAEALQGQVFAQSPTLRSKMIVATKCGVEPGVPYNSSKQYIIDACEASLKRLRTDVVDLYQIHRPDLLAHPQEIAAALDQLKRDGKVRAVGVSNYTPSQVEALAAFVDTPLVSQQPEFSPWHLDPIFDGTTDQCMRLDMAILAWSPLAGGRLMKDAEAARQSVSGAEAGDRIAKLIQVLDGLASEHGCSRGDIIIAFLLAHPANIIPIIGTQNIDRIRACTKAVSIELQRKEWYRIIEASLGKPMP